MSRRFLVSSFFFLLMLLVMRGQGATLLTPVSPYGILDLEFAGNIARYNQLMAAWSRNDLLLNMYLDLLFIPAYTFFFLNCFELLAAKRNNISGRKAFRIIAIGAAVLDLAENALLLVCIHRAPADAMLKATVWAAGLKFLLVAIAAIWLTLGIIRFFLQKARTVKMPS